MRLDAPTHPALQGDLRDLWIVSDTHFHHARIVDYCGRPEDHDRLMTERWQETVSENDVVLHLGDLCLARRGQTERTEELLAKLPGRMLMIRGNHDKLPAHWYARQGIELVSQFAIDYDGWTVSFSHRPGGEPKPYDDPRRLIAEPQQINVHGHIHDKLIDDWRMINVCVEQTDYRPVRLGGLLDDRIAELSELAS